MAAAETVPFLGPPPLGAAGSATERALEEAAASGTLRLAGRRLRCFPDSAAQRWDLSDTTQADLSRNRFAEVPAAALALLSLEGLSLYHNCLRSVPPAMANLQALTYLNLSRNQLSALPPSLCRLPLRVLLASNNRLAQLPDDIGAMGALRQLDVSCNELRSLPPSMGRLASLRDLNLRRNQLSTLPPELSELPLVRLDFSCNRVAAIPRCFRRLRLLQTLLSDNNPLLSPPAHVCLKGRVHIFKYLQSEGTDSGRHCAVSPCLPEELCPLRQRGGLDSGFNSVDSGSKRWSGNESTDEFSELSLRLTQGPKEKRSAAAGDSDPEQLELLEGSTTGGEEEEDAAPPRPPPPPGGSPVSVGWGGDERRRRRPPQSLQLWQERERRQRALRGRRGEEGDSDPSEPGTFLQQRWLRAQGLEQTPRAPPPAAAVSPHHEPPHPREPGAAPRPNSFLFRVNSAKLGAAPPDTQRSSEGMETQQSTEALLAEERGGAALCHTAARLPTPLGTPGTTAAELEEETPSRAPGGLLTTAPPPPHGDPPPLR